MALTVEDTPRGGVAPSDRTADPAWERVLQLWKLIKVYFLIHNTKKSYLFWLLILQFQTLNQ